MNVFRRATLPLMLAAAACELPTDAPILEQRWVLAVERTSISVDEMIPAGVAVEDGSFSVSVESVDAAASLGSLCPGCGPLAGLTAPKPSFTGSFAASADLPAGVGEVTVTGGSVRVDLRNGFGFDPIRPGGGATGSLRVTLTDAGSGAVLGSASLDGAVDAFPPGSARTLDVPLASGSIRGGISATVDVSSPAGDPVTIDLQQEVTATATVSSLLVSSATVEVGGRSVTLDPVELDVADLDSGIVDRIQAGAIILDVTNPFGVGVQGQLEIRYPGGSVAKVLDLPADPSARVRLEYTGAELRSFLGQPDVVLSGSAAVSSSAGSVVVTPSQSIELEGTIDLTIRVGGGAS